MHGIINSGHVRDIAYVTRCTGEKHTPTKFTTWSPKVIAMIGEPADTILDRSIPIYMRRKIGDE